jgi:hypothetical protein
MDLTFTEAMQSVESFHPARTITLFEGMAFRGVVRICVPDVCVHGDQFEMMTPHVEIFANGRAAASYTCGCVYLGEFISAAAA